MYILGLSAFYHDSAACLLKDGKIIAALQEERFSRIKHDSSFPSNAVKACLKIANISIKDVNYFVFYEKPILKFDRILETYISYAPKGFKSFKTALPIWIKDKLFQKKKIIENLERLGYKSLLEKKILFSEHHLSHAASAFYPSPFNDANILTLDGVGEWATSTICRGLSNKIDIIKEIEFPHSLGLLYSAFTAFLGFKVNSGEYKLMGLAPYGEPKYLKLIKDQLIDIKKDGSYRLNMKFFDYCTGFSMINKDFEKIFKIKTKDSLTSFSKKHMDIAASVQKVLEEIVCKMAVDIRNEKYSDNLCLAGGVALNCVANGIIVKNNIFKKIWIQPAAGDAGGSLGAAFLAWHKHFKKPCIPKKNKDKMQGAYLGNQYTENDIKNTLKKLGANFKTYTSSELILKSAKYLKDKKVLGWFQGRMEFGPRALGNRSILADPRSSKMQSSLNLKIKFRESFRPFAPAVIKKFSSKWFDINTDSPYMLLVSKVKKNKLLNTKDNITGIDKLKQKRSVIPAVTHVDNTARIQTVDGSYNKIFFQLLNKFNNLTKCPLLVNTSFNIRSEPIVESPSDAFKCFMGTKMDILVIGKNILVKEEQNSKLKKNYLKEFDLD